MTLLVTLFAAITCTIVWYAKNPGDKYMTGILCFMFWGASIMWFVDAIFEYAELGADYFSPEPLDMLNDAYLGLSVIALGMIIWLVILLIKDPRDVVKSVLFKKK